VASQTFSLIEIAGLLNVSRGTVDRWLKQGCPFIERADRNRGREWQLSLPDVVEWRERRAVEQAIGDTSKLDIDEARRRKVAAEAALAELELAKQRGQVVSVEVAMQVVGDQLSVCRSRLLSMPNKIGPLVAPVTDVNECVERMRLAVVEALDELIGLDITGGLGPPAGANARSDEGDDGGEVPPAADAKRKPMGGPRKKAQP
jgi:terminase small subunit / prophage DNA-packing protein